MMVIDQLMTCIDHRFNYTPGYTFHVETNNGTSVTYNVKDISEGYLGQCEEFPAIIIQANSYDELKEKMKSAVEGYFEAFPDEKLKIKPLKHERIDVIA